MKKVCQYFLYTHVRKLRKKQHSVIRLRIDKISERDNRFGRLPSIRHGVTNEDFNSSL